MHGEDSFYFNKKTESQIEIFALDPNTYNSIKTQMNVLIRMVNQLKQIKEKLFQNKWSNNYDNCNQAKIDKGRKLEAVQDSQTDMHQIVGFSPNYNIQKYKITKLKYSYIIYPETRKYDNLDSFEFYLSMTNQQRDRTRKFLHHFSLLLHPMLIWYKLRLFFHRNRLSHVKRRMQELIQNRTE